MIYGVFIRMTNMTSTTKISFIVVFLFSLTAFGQSTPNSVYNAYGVGRLNDFGLESFKSMGNAAIGMRSDNMVNLKNPAALNSISYPNQIFDVGMSMSSFSQRTVDKSNSTMIGGVQNVNLWFRPSGRFAFTIGANQFSNTNYNVTDLYHHSDVVQNYDVIVEGTGGLSRIYFGLATEPVKNLNIGGRVSLLLGQIGSTQSITNNSLIDNIQLVQNSSLSQAVFDFGAQYVFERSAHDWVIGATYRPSFLLSQNVESMISESGYDTLVTKSKSNLYLPEMYGVGVSGRFGTWRVSLDGELEKWSKNEGTESNRYRDKYSLSLGAEYIRGKRSESYFDRMAFRFGGSFNNYYVAVNNTKFNQIKLTTGVGLPTQRQSGYINVGYEYQGLGTTEANLVLETLHTFTLNFSIRSMWFLKTVYD